MTPGMIDTLIMIIEIISIGSMVGVIGYTFYRLWKESNFYLPVLIILIGIIASFLLLPYLVGQAVDNNWLIISIFRYKVWIKVFGLILLFLGLWGLMKLIEDIRIGKIEVSGEVGPSVFYNRKKQPASFWFFSCFYLVSGIYVCVLSIMALMTN